MHLHCIYNKDLFRQYSEMYIIMQIFLNITEKKYFVLLSKFEGYCRRADKIRHYCSIRGSFK